MIQLTVLSGRKAGTQVVARRFPFLIGRASRAGLVLEDEGIWDEHLDLQVRDAMVQLVAGPEAFVSVNGERVREVELHNGDLIELPSVQLRFGLSGAVQRSSWWREKLTWAGLAALCLIQIALIYLLSE